MNKYSKAMKRNSKKNDSKRKEDSSAERSSEISSFEPALRAANEKFARFASVIGLERIMQYDYCLINLGGTAIYLRPIIWGEGFYIVEKGGMLK